MPDIPVNSPLGYIGIFSLFVGFLLILAGLRIFKIEKVTIVPGPKTWGIGVALVVLGVVLLLPDVIASSSRLFAPTPTMVEEASSTAMAIPPTDTGFTPIASPEKPDPVRSTSTPSIDIPPYTQPQNPIRVIASSIGVPSEDAGGNPITYEATKAVDGFFETAWVVEGSGVGEYIRLDFASPIQISEIQLIPGYAKIDPYDQTDRFFQIRRVRKVRFEFSDGSSIESGFDERPELQSTKVGNTVSTFVKVVILETTDKPSDPWYDRVGISEIVVQGVTF